MNRTQFSHTTSKGNRKMSGKKKFGRNPSKKDMKTIVKKPK